MANLAQHLLDTAATAEGAAALRTDRASLTYGEFLTGARHVAAGLQARGIGVGDRVGTVLPNVLSTPVVHYGALMAGAVVVPVDPLLPIPEIAERLTGTGVRLVVGTEDSARPAAEAGIEAIVVDPRSPQQLMADDAVPTFPVARADDDPAVIRPDGAAATHAGLRFSAHATKETLVQATADDVLLGCLPLSSARGLTLLDAVVLAGASLTLLPRFDGGAALSAIERDRVTVFAGGPAMYGAMLAAADRGRVDVSSLRLCLWGGPALAEEVRGAVEEAFGCAVRPAPADREEVGCR